MSTTIISMQDEHGPGYRLEAELIPGRVGTTLQLSSVLPGARDPRPHMLLQVTLPPDALARLADLIKEGASDND